MTMTFKVISVVIFVLKKINAVIDKILLSLGVVGFLGIIVSITAGIVARTPLTPFTPLAWPEELSTFLFICVAFFGASCCAYRRREIVVDFLLSKFPDKTLVPLNIVIRIMIMGFMVLIIIGGIALYPRIRGVSIALGIPRNLYYVPILISAVAMLLINFADLLESIQSLRKKSEEGAD